MIMSRKSAHIWQRMLSSPTILKIGNRGSSEQVTQKESRKSKERALWWEQIITMFFSILKQCEALLNLKTKREKSSISHIPLSLFIALAKKKRASAW